MKTAANTSGARQPHYDVQRPPQSLPYGVPGTGNFGRWLGDQDTYSIAVMQEKIMKTIDTVPAAGSADSLFTIGDFGCADAAVSIPLIRSIIRRVREKSSKNRPIQVVYEDQPTNDFNSVFKRVHGLIPEPPTYLKDFSDVFVMASGTGFFEQILPPTSADVIFSFIAAHYLSVPITKYQDSFHRYPNATTEERKIVEAQAAKDWETFLLQRARELKKGGVLIVSTPAHDPQGKIKGVKHWAQHCEEGMLNMWRRMRDEGKITEQEFYDTNMHRCPRYLEEYKAPFASPSSPVRKAGLELISAELIVAPCVAQNQWKEKMDKEGIDDRKTWAQAVVQQHRVWANSNFIRGLSNSRSSGEKEALVDELFERLEAETALCHPMKYLNDYLLGYVFARKV